MKSTMQVLQAVSKENGVTAYQIQKAGKPALKSFQTESC
jgi:hypothetical protein